jgi:molybdopterin/thiamine biosynthesis adenylyltransferase/rhodanese-related sulfurtransferase
MTTPVVSGPVKLTKDEILRYARNLITPEVGMAGQLKLKQAKVICIGTGGLGSPISIYLVAAGVGKLGLVDADVVEVSNLQRQVLHGTSDVGRAKVDSARDTLRELNPHVELEMYNARLSRQNALEILKDYDIVVDGTDNIPSRYLLSDACVLLGKPLVHGSVFRFQGYTTVLCAPGGPCYRCVYPEPPPPELVQRIAVGGIVGVQPGIIGCIQALEVIKLIVGQGKPLIGRLLVFDGMNLKFRELTLRKDPDCEACGARPTLTRDLVDYNAFCGVRAPAEPAAGIAEVSVQELRRIIGEERPCILIDVREAQEYEAGHIPGAVAIPLGEILYHLHEFTWADDIVVYSGTDERAQEAAETLLRFNFRRTRVLKGGYPAWTQPGEPAPPSS